MIYEVYFFLKKGEKLWFKEIFVCIDWYEYFLGDVVRYVGSIFKEFVDVELLLFWFVGFVFDWVNFYEVL